MLNMGSIKEKLKIDRPWIYLNTVEVEAHRKAIETATGVCATLGLGLGYYILKVISKPEVTYYKLVTLIVA